MDNQFLEQYIHLEKLCGDIYGNNHGISSYLEDMESTNKRIQAEIPCWEDIYHKLKELRWKRNQYVHEGVILYEDADIECLRQFYQMIIVGKDVLSLRRELEEKVPSVYKEYYRKDDCLGNNRKSHFGWLLLFVLGMVLGITIIILLILYL